MQEKELVQKCLQGDESAFNTLALSCRLKIFRGVHRLIKDEEIAEDITQEAFLHAYQHLDQFRMESSFYTWVYRIARNLAIDTFKKKKEISFRDELLVPSAPAKDEVADHELENAIQEGLKTLSEKQRVVFEKFDIQKLSTQEISDLLKIPSGTVRSRLYYARKHMKAFLNNHFKP
jgi:RNA polymerase sigma-70 factor (ECF subfamily)